MSYQLTLHEKPGYLHAVIEGENTPENVKGYLQELLEVCSSRKCRRILLEERLKGEALPVGYVYEIISQASLKAQGLMEAIAFVDVFPRHENVKFGENVAANRGIPVKSFKTVPEAEEWIKKAPSPDP
jgi:hypothetical protein